MVDYADDTTIYAVTPRQLSRPQVIESLIGIWRQSTLAV